MSRTRARAVRSVLTTLLVASGLVFSVAGYAAGPDRERGRDREDRREVSSDRSSAPEAQRTEAQPGRAEQTRPGQPAPQLQAGPPAHGGGRIWQERRWQAPERVPQAPTRLEPRRSAPEVSPPGRMRGGWQQPDRATPYRLYQAPEQREPSDSPRRLQPPRSREGQPDRPSAPPDRPFSQPWRVDTGRPAPQPERDVEVRRPPASQGRPEPALPQVGRERSREQERERLRERERERVRRPEAGQRPQPPVQQGKGRLHSVPEARFRGPEAEKNVRVVRPEARERLQVQLRDRVLEQNRDRARITRGRPTVDVVGNPVSADVSILVRDKVSRLSIGFTRLRRTHGDPTFPYLCAPRSPRDYWEGYWDGYADGYWAGRHRWHGHRTVIFFYYGYYWSDPFWFAFYYPGYYPAIYHYWGWTPAWVYPERCYYAPVEYIYVPATPYRYYGTGYYVDERGADQALRDIRRAWLDSDISSLAYHLTDSVDIRVYFDGEYEYSTTTEDYYAMTADAMATTQTVSLTFNRPIWLSAYEFFVTGRHVFYDPNGDRQTVYVSYRLRKLGGDWYLVAVGSSLEPIRHQYKDFRY